MVAYKNFYETVQEASMRLNGTVVMYEGHPHYILNITDHKKDGIFRVYMERLNLDKSPAFSMSNDIPYKASHYDSETSTSAVGEAMDVWLEKNPDKGIVRKFANSSKFNDFVPFPLGYVLWRDPRGKGKSELFYTERLPTRNTKQGLSSSAVLFYAMSLNGGDKANGRYHVPAIWDPAMVACYINHYPSFKMAVEGVTSKGAPGVPFCRNFALLRGPADTVFLSYKDSVVGVCENVFTPYVSTRLSKEYKHLKELVTELNVFSKVE